MAVGAIKAADYVADLQARGETGPPGRVPAVRSLAIAGPPDPARGQKMCEQCKRSLREALRAMALPLPGLNAILDCREDAAGRAADAGVEPHQQRDSPAAAGRGGRRGGLLSPTAMRQRGARRPIRWRRRARPCQRRCRRRGRSDGHGSLSYAGKPAAGKKVFDADAGCVACHNVGAGPKKLGPDLTHIGAKYGRQALLDNILSPSEGISPEFVPTTFTMKSGDTVSGLIAEERPDRILVQVGPNQQQPIKPADVASRKEIRVSLMPEGLLNAVSLQQVADLLEYLASLK